MASTQAGLASSPAGLALAALTGAGIAILGVVATQKLLRRNGGGESVEDTVRRVMNEYCAPQPQEVDDDDSLGLEARASPSLFQPPSKRGNTRFFGSKTNLTSLSAAEEIKGGCWVICLTGGPCGGKSSCLTQLVKELAYKDFQVFVAPEMPTLMQTECLCEFPFVPNATVEQVAHMNCWEGNKMQLQENMEDALHQIAVSSGKRTIIICDRGVPDSAAYVDENHFQDILDHRNWNQDKLFDRYSLVIHLETAAIDTSVYETLAAENEARREDKQQAIEQDHKTQQAWVSHRNVKMIRNRNCVAPGERNPARDFEIKKKKVVDAVFDHLEIPMVDDDGGEWRVTKRVFEINGHISSSLFSGNPKPTRLAIDLHPCISL